MAVVEQLKTFGVESDLAYHKSTTLQLINARLQHNISPYELILIENSTAPMLAEDICEIIHDHNTQSHSTEQTPRN